MTQAIAIGMRAQVYELVYYIYPFRYYYILPRDDV